MAPERIVITPSGKTVKIRDLVTLWEAAQTIADEDFRSPNYDGKVFRMLELARRLRDQR